MAEAKAGDTFELKIPVGKYQPIYYAGASGDFNLIHIDAEFGKMVGLGGAILQGLCTMAFVARTCADWAGGPDRLKRIKVRFASPVKPEDDVTVMGTVAAVEEGAATVELQAVNQNRVEVISRAWAKVALSE